MPENEIPYTIPPTAAEFIKPYLEFEFNGRIYRLEELKGGHNGVVAGACQSSPPRWDEERQHWVVDIENNLIDIDLSNQPEVHKAFDSRTSAFKGMHIFNNPRNSYKSKGQLISHTVSKSETPKFPVDCEFDMFIRIKVPGKPSLINTKPFKLYTKNLMQWPPPEKTTYLHDDDIELYPEWVPFIERFSKPVVKILAGDKTIITKVIPEEQFTSTETGINISRLLTKLWNRIT